MKTGAGHIPSQKEFLSNVIEKVNHPDFYGDMEGLLRPGVVYSRTEALDWLRDEIVSRMK